MEGLKLIKCEKCGVLHPAGKDHECDIKVLHGYQCGVHDTYSRIMKTLNEMEENYRAEIAEKDCINDDPFSDGILSAMFCVIQTLTMLKNEDCHDND